MSARLIGSKELQARLAALGTAWKPIGRRWGKETVGAGRNQVPERTGRLRRSIRVTSVSNRAARVGAHYTAYFIDAGVKAHWIRSKSGRPMVFKSRGKTTFARAVHHRGFKARPFRKRIAREGLRRTPMDQVLYDLWNSAA